MGASSDPTPKKLANKAAHAAAEPMEGSGGTERNAELQSTVRTQSRAAVSQAQGRIREAVTRNKKERLTALLHHVGTDCLRWAFLNLKKAAAPGVDEVTWDQYAENLEANLADLHARPNVKFDFLGYCFRPRWVKRLRDNTMFCGFNPAVSPTALKTMRSTIRDLGIRHRTQMTLADIARQINPLLRGWIEYYGRYAPSALHPVLDTSTRSFWPGRGGSSSALLLTRSARVAFSNASQRTTQNSSCTGGSG